MGVINPNDLLGLPPAARAALERLDSVSGVQSSRGSVLFSDTTAKPLFYIPPNATLLDFLVWVETAFNSSGTDLLDLGKLGTANHYINDLDVAATGKKAPTIGNLGDVGTAGVTVIGTFIQSVADATTGKLWVTALWTPQAA